MFYGFGVFADIHNWNLEFFKIANFHQECYFVAFPRCNRRKIVVTQSKNKYRLTCAPNEYLNLPVHPKDAIYEQEKSDISGHLRILVMTSLSYRPIRVASWDMKR